MVAGVIERDKKDGLKGDDMKTLKTFLITSLMCFLTAGIAFSAPILVGSSSDDWSWTANDGERTATADFSVSDGSLYVILTNTSPSVPDNGHLLVGLFFDWSDSDLTGASVWAPEENLSSLALIDSYIIDSGNVDLRYEFGFMCGINNNSGRGAYGISSSGMDPEGGSSPDGWTGFGVTTIINSDHNYAGPQAPGGPDFGISNGTFGGENDIIYIDNYVEMSFPIGDGTGGEISNVHFLYGTSYVVPVPSSILLLGFGLAGLAGVRKRFKKA